MARRLDLLPPGHTVAHPGEANRHWMVQLCLRDRDCTLFLFFPPLEIVKGTCTGPRACRRPRLSFKMSVLQILRFPRPPFQAAWVFCEPPSRSRVGLSLSWKERRQLLRAKRAERLPWTRWPMEQPWPPRARRRKGKGQLESTSLTRRRTDCSRSMTQASQG